MKYVVLSFDDGAKDFYTRALPILKKYNLPSVLNIIPDFMEETKINNYVSWKDVAECIENGVEIANHSANHTNALNDIVRGEKEIRTHTNTTERIGFASPHSEISNLNFNEYKCLLDSGIAAYIRSGNQLKRDGYFHAFLYFLYKYTKSCAVFFKYNKRNIIMPKQLPETFFPSVTCNRDNSAKQVISFIKKMPNDSSVILMFHKILEKSDDGYKTHKWSNTVEDFDAICRFLSETDDISVITQNALCNLLKNN